VQLPRCLEAISQTTVAVCILLRWKNAQLTFHVCWKKT